MSDYRQHPEYLAIIRGVLVTPADNLPRLVLADWLDEHDQTDRAAFIRVQVHHPEGFGGRETPALDLPAAPAWYCQAHAWLTGGAGDAELHAVVDGRCRGISKQPEWVRHASGAGWRLRVVWHRGFIVEVRSNSDSWERRGAALVSSHPIMRYIPTDMPRGTIVERVVGTARLEAARRAAGLV